MEILDGTSRPGKRNYPEHLAIILNGGWSKDSLGILAGIPLPMPGIPSAADVTSDQTRHLAGLEFQRTLRSLVHDWIESGKTKYGEEPWARRASVQAIAKISEYQERKPPTVIFIGDGRIAVSMFGPPSTGLVSPTNPDEALASARDSAFRDFLLLLDSPNRERLFECKRCGKYFVRDRAPRKLIKSGRYCAKRKCRGSASALRMNTTRGNRRSEMVGFAADSWDKCLEHPDKRSKWIAEQVNRRTAMIKAKAGRDAESHFPKITGRWVTQHMTEIEAEVERRKHVSKKTR